jgi:polyisoprenoid-binding protein YceI
MTRNARNIALGAIGLGLAGALLAVLYLLRPPAEASAPIESIPLAVETSTPPPEDETVATEDPGAESEIPQGVTIYTISQAESEAQFAIGETLRGQRTTAVGVTNQVAGEIAVDLANPAAAQVGAILINARTLATDSEQRNRAIRNFILDTGAYEFITFTPAAINGLPETAAVGDTLAVAITGNLTIRDITAEVTFTGNVTVVSPTRLEGSLTATVLRSAYELVIPSVPQVADVDDEVVLTITFVAEG